jgi:NAD(P)H-hydrate epimerase
VNPFPGPSITVPSVSARQMSEVDRVMEEDLGIGLIQMMENAGRGLARLTSRRFLDNDPAGARVEVLVGKGGNGGGALVAARRLAGWGAQVSVQIAGPAEELGEVPGRQLQILLQMGVEVKVGPSNPRQEDDSGDTGSPSVILDGLIGYSLSGPPRGPVAEWIHWSAQSRSPIVSLDVPSGLDASSGEPLPPSVKAAATFTLALPKTGLRKEPARPMVGELYLGDIGVPPGVYERFGFDVNGLFSSGDILFLG